MGLIDKLKQDEAEVDEIIKQERNIEQHIENISSSIRELKEKEEEAEQLRQNGNTSQAEQLEEEITELNRKIIYDGFEQLIRQIRKGEQETENILADIGKAEETIDTNRLQRLVAVADLIESHFVPKHQISSAYYAIHPEPAKASSKKNLGSSYPRENLMDKLDNEWSDHWLGKAGHGYKEETIIFTQISQRWDKVPGAIYEIAKIGDEIVEDLKMLETEMEELEQEIREDGQILERAEQNTSSQQTEQVEENEEAELGKAEQAVQEMREELQEMIQTHEQEEENIEQYAPHLEDCKQAAEEILEFTEETKNQIEKLEENRSYYLSKLSTNNFPPKVMKHLEMLEHVPMDSVEQSMQKTIELCEKAEQELAKRQ